MARYIDADKVIEAIRKRFNSYFEIPCDRDDWRVQEIIGKVKKVIQEQPTADVVPRAEYEKAIIDRNAARLGMLAEHERLKMAKAEVAREIFEEIETLCESYKYFYEGTYSPELKEAIAELKKKYTGEQK